MSNVATPTTDANTGAAFTGVVANKGSIFLVGFNAAGTLKACQGSIVDLDASGAFIQAPQLPGMPLDFCPVGYIVIKAGSTASAAGWVLGTGNLATPATGITLTYVDVVRPRRKSGKRTGALALAPLSFSGSYSSQDECRLCTMTKPWLDEWVFPRLNVSSSACRIGT
jgi:hypothetical protein